MAISGLCVRRLSMYRNNIIVLLYVYTFVSILIYCTDITLRSRTREVQLYNVHTCRRIHMKNRVFFCFRQ